MRRPVLAAMTGVTAVVVGLGIRAGGQPPSAADVLAAPVGVLGSSSAASPAPSSGTTTTGKSAATTVNGAAASTRYGPVQVQIVVTAGKVVSAQAVLYPTQDHRDQEINGYAVPILNQEAVDSQSAHVDTVSGATFTSWGYQSSLQSALDKAQQAGLL